MSIRDWQRRVHAIATSKGWWDDYPVSDAPSFAGGLGHFILTTDQILAKLALIHSEVSEALEDARTGKMVTGYEPNGKPVGFASELADVVIRCMDLASAMGIDLEEEIAIKSAFNETRTRRHGGKLA